MINAVVYSVVHLVGGGANPFKLADLGALRCTLPSRYGDSRRRLNFAHYISAQATLLGRAYFKFLPICTLGPSTAKTGLGSQQSRDVKSQLRTAYS